MPGSRLRKAGDVATRLLREIGGVSQGEAIDVSARPEGGAVVRVVRAPNRRSFNENVFGGHIEGLSVARSGEVRAWMSLRRDSYGAIVNARSSPMMRCR